METTNSETPKSHDVEFYIRPPEGHKTNQINQLGSGPEAFRSLAAELIREDFDGTCWILKESIDSNGVELKVAVRRDEIELFRKRMASMGFKAEECKNGLDHKMDRGD